MTAFANLVRFTPTAGGTTDWTVSAAVGGCQTPALANVQNGVPYKFYAVSTDLTQWEISTGNYNSGTTTFARTTVLYNSSGTGTAAGQSGAGTKINFSTVPQVSIVAAAEDVSNASLLPTTQSLTSGSGATYTTGIQNGQRATWIEVFMVGGGGGGGGVTNGSPGATVAGSAGGTTTFNSINAAGGSGAGGSSVATNTSVGGAGGTGGTGSATRRQQGGPGQGTQNLQATVALSTGIGGTSYFGGGGTSVQGNSSSLGISAAANTGAGGSGAAGGTATFLAGAGGGAGEFAFLIINNPSATYTYTIGAGGAGGVGGTNNGGAGGSGFIFVIEHYGS